MSQVDEQSTNNTVTVHLLSDSTGSTLETLWPAIKRRFPQNGFNVKRYHKAEGEDRLSEAQLDDFIRDIINTRGTNVVYMTVESDARVALIKAALGPLKIECVDPLGESVAALAKISGQTPLTHGQVNDDESARIERQMVAMRFWQHCDDGANLDEAFSSGDIVLIAQSRVGKTGTCAVLAMGGRKVGNNPFVQGITDSEDSKKRLIKLMQQHPNVPVIGMTRDIAELAAYRRNRIRATTNNPARLAEQEEKYFGKPFVARETLAFNRFCQDVGISMIVDTTRCQPEEVATRVLDAIKTARAPG